MPHFLVFGHPDRPHIRKDQPNKKHQPNKKQTKQTNHQPQKIKPAKIQQTRENNTKNIFTGSKGKKKQ